MYMYRFNSLSGKIVDGGAQRVAQALKGSTTQDSAKIIYESAKVKFPTVIQTVKPPRPGYGEVPAALRRNYEHFQKDNGVPVHLKVGTVDVALYYTTIAGCVIGLFECFRYYYQASFPKKD